MWSPDYLTLEKLRKWVSIDDVEDDDELEDDIAGASRAIDRCCGRQFGQVDAPEARVYIARWSWKLRRYVAQIDDLATVTGSLLDGVELDPANLYPRNAVAKGKVWEELRLSEDEVGHLPCVSHGGGRPDREVTVTAPWGWPAVPRAVMLACRIQAARFANRKDSPYGVAGSPQQGTELRLLARVDPDVAVGLKYYVREWWAA